VARCVVKRDGDVMWVKWRDVIADAAAGNDTNNCRPTRHSRRSSSSSCYHCGLSLVDAETTLRTSSRSTGRRPGPSSLQGGAQLWKLSAIITVPSANNAGTPQQQLAFTALIWHNNSHLRHLGIVIRAESRKYQLISGACVALLQMTEVALRRAQLSIKRVYFHDRRITAILLLRCFKHYLLCGVVVLIYTRTAVCSVVQYWLF